MAFGAIREMHGLSAAGTALKASVDDDGVTHIETHVVDPVAVLKVKTNVYKGFSIGGKVLARDPVDRTIITKLKLNEISLVDRPCNPEAVIGMWKAEGAHLEDLTAREPVDDAVAKLERAFDDAFAALTGTRLTVKGAGLQSFAATLANLDMRLTKLGAPREPEAGSLAAMLKALPGQPEMTVQALCGLVDDLTKRLEIAEAVPAPPKCAIGTFAISKAADVNPGGREPAADVSAEGRHRLPGQPVRRRTGDGHHQGRLGAAARADPWLITATTKKVEST